MQCTACFTRDLPFIILLQIQLKDLLRVAGPKKTTTTTLKGNSLMELMKLKPPLDIAQPVATATATGHRKNRNMGLTAKAGLKMHTIHYYGNVIFQ